jgi:hypothetical protein
MLLSTLMAAVTPNPAFTGWSTNDDMVLAIDLDPTNVTPTPVAGYAVVQTGVEGLDAQLNPIMTEKNYIRAGQSSIKTGNQRTFKIGGDRYIGDAAQDYMLSFPVAQGRGSACVTNYVYYNMLTGIGESGQVSIIVNSAGGGNAGEASAIDIELKKVGAAPAAYTYVAGSIDALALSSIVPADGATGISKTGNIVLTFNNAIASSFVSIIAALTGDVFACTQAWDATKKILTITPSSALAATTKYVVAINGVKDVYGQSLADVAKDFTTTS